MNELAHFKVQIQGIPIHFIHEKGKGPKPMPLLIHHGWPWTFWDLRRVIGPLTDPAAYGGDPKDAFDVVLISLPGHGFSIRAGRLPGRCPPDAEEVVREVLQPETVPGAFWRRAPRLL